MAWPNSWGIKWFTVRSFKLHSKALQSHVWEKVLLFRTLSLINCWTIFCRSIILKTVSISAKIEVNEWMKTKMAAISYQPRILSPKYEQMDNLKPLTVCSEMAKHRSLSLSDCIGCAVDWDVTLILKWNGVLEFASFMHTCMCCLLVDLISPKIHMICMRMT